MKLEDHIKALIEQYKKLQKRHKFHADNAYYQFQSEMWQAMADDFGIMVEDLQQALYNADDVKLTEQPEPQKPDAWHNVDPRKTAPAGKWCADSAAQAAESAAKEAWNNG